MSLFPLPLECLRLILDKLAHELDLTSLARMLRVNKYTCYATLPYLYSDPFQTSFHKRSAMSRFMLACTLLRQVAPEHMSELLKIVLLDWIERSDRVIANKSNDYDNPVDSSTAPQQSSIDDSKGNTNAYTPVIDYLPYIRHLDYDKLNFLGNISNFVDDTDHIASSMLRLHLLVKYQAEFKALVEKGLMYPNEKFDYWMHMQQDLRRDMLFTFCQPESIQGLNIPLSDIGRYIPIVDRLKSLSSVYFIIDLRLTEPAFMGQQELSTEGAAIMENMASFVEKHKLVHKNVLTTTGCNHDLGLQQCPEEYQLRLLERLPPLQKPRVLHLKNWPQFVTHPDETDLRSVEEFAGDRRWKDRLPPDGSFLSQCRSLKRIETHRYGRVSYQWAVEEKRRRLAAINEGMPAEPLVPVRVIITTSEPDCLQYDVEDAAYAFSDTLEQLVANGQSLGGVPTSVTQPINIGQGWFLPRLHTLKLSSRDLPLKIAPDALSGCQALQTVDLHDHVTDYDSQDIQTWLPAELPHLTSLILGGIPALSFHPDTLYSTSSLTYLELRIDRGHDRKYYIPPIEELELASRLLWSWDWSLPNMTAISLAAEFAYRFQFRMLQGCPNIDSLLLDLSARTSIHKRALHNAELVCAQIEQPHKNTQAQQFQYFQLTKLRHLGMFGQWHFHDAFLRTLLQEVVPNVKYLTLIGCSGYDLEGLMDVTSELHELDHCDSSLEVDEMDAKAAGLVVARVDSLENRRIVFFDLDDIRYYQIRS